MTRRSLLAGFLALPVAAKFAPPIRADRLLSLHQRRSWGYVSAEEFMRLAGEEIRRRSYGWKPSPEPLTFTVEFG